MVKCQPIGACRIYATQHSMLMCPKIIQTQLDAYWLTYVQTCGHLRRWRITIRHEMWLIVRDVMCARSVSQELRVLAKREQNSRMVAVGYGWDVLCPDDPVWEVPHIEPSHQEQAQQQYDPQHQWQLYVHCQCTEEESKWLQDGDRKWVSSWVS